MVVKGIELTEFRLDWSALVRQENKKGHLNGALCHFKSLRDCYSM